MKRNTCTLPTVTGDQLAAVSGGADRIAAAANSIDPNVLDMMFSQMQSSVQNLTTAQQNSTGNMLPLAAMAFAMHKDAPVAQQPLVIPIPVGGGWHHHHRCR